jgi:hypothetical protein
MIESPADLAVEVMAVIETHQDRHDQMSYRRDASYTGTIEDYREDPLNPACQTSFCFAGWVAALDRVRWADYLLTIGDPDVCDCSGLRCMVAAHQMPVDQYAARRLGLYVGTVLFDSHNDLDALRAGVKALVNGENVEDAVYRVRHAEYDSHCTCRACL